MPSLTPKKTKAKKEVVKVKPSPNVSPAAASSGVGQKMTDINTDVSQLPSRTTLTRDDVKTLLDKWRLLTYEGLYTVEKSFNNEQARIDVIKTTYIDAVKALIQRYKQLSGVTEEAMLLDFNYTLIWWARQVLQTKRRKVVFIVGDTVSDNFYKYAKLFFEHRQTTEPDLEIRESEKTFREIRDHLHNNGDLTQLPYGEVSIVTHANAYGATNMKVEDSDQHGASAESLKKFTDPVSYKALDSASKVLIRGCSVGNSSDFMQAFADAIGKDDKDDEELPHAYAPRYIQVYGLFGGVNVEFFQEFWYIGYPANLTLDKEKIVAKFKERYPTEQIDWGKLYDIHVKNETYKHDVEFDGVFILVPAAQNLQLATEMLRAAGENPAGVQVLERTDVMKDDGMITVTLKVDWNGERNINIDVLPKLDTQERLRAFAGRQADTAAELRTLENHSNLTPDDFFWEKKEEAIAGFTLRKKVTLFYSRKLNRLERDLTNPRGTDKEADRVKPDEENTSHYAHVSPPLHFHKPAP